jgi:hypothetical protein
VAQPSNLELQLKIEELSAQVAQLSDRLAALNQYVASLGGQVGTLADQERGHYEREIIGLRLTCQMLLGHVNAAGTSGVYNYETYCDFDD